MDEISFKVRAFFILFPVGISYLRLPNGYTSFDKSPSAIALLNNVRRCLKYMLIVVTLCCESSIHLSYFCKNAGVISTKRTLCLNFSKLFLAQLYETAVLI